jgi:hypothetical protein
VSFRFQFGRSYLLITIFASNYVQFVCCSSLLSGATTSFHFENFKKRRILIPSLNHSQKNSFCSDEFAKCSISFTSEGGGTAHCFTVHKQPYWHVFNCLAFKYQILNRSQANQPSQQVSQSVSQTSHPIPCYNLSRFTTGAILRSF